MFDAIEELIDVYNVTNTLEGYSQLCFHKTTLKGVIMYHLNFEKRHMRYIGNEFIRLFVYDDRVNVTIEYHDYSLLKYLNKKYLSRSITGSSHTTFEIKDVSKLEEFIQKDMECILEYHINDAGVV